MDAASMYIVHALDLRKRSRCCNNYGCNKIPTKETTIIETDIVTKKERDLATVYFCSQHYMHISSLIEQLNSLAGSGKTIGRKTMEIGYITY